MYRAGGLVLALALVVAACGSVADETPVAHTDEVVDDGSAPAPPSVEGTSWTLVVGGGPGGDIALVEGYPITLSFESGQLGGTASCNSYGGSYLLDGNRLVLGEEISSTAMACEPAEAMTAESVYLTALFDVTGVDLVGDELVLSGPASELVFARQADVPVAELVGQPWVLDTLIDGETASSVAGDPATLRLNADGTLVGSTGCRTLSGDYTISGASVLFTTFSADGECPPDLVDQDNQVVTVLGDGFTVEIEGDRMTLTSQGSEGLVYRAVDELP